MRVSWNAGIAVWLLAGITAGNAQAPATPTQANPPPATAAEAPQRTYGISLLGAPSLPPDFKYLPLCEPRRTQRRGGRAQHRRHLRQLQPVHRPRHRGRRRVPGLGHADDAQCRRGRDRVRPPREV